ncbi:MAG TPA: septum formation family protein [Nocardioidaceae bacterium]|nr:septum formation family protein [Nocardioidaceae bacterium]
MTIWHRAAAVLAAVVVLSGCGAAADLVESEPTTEPSPTDPTSPSPTPTDPSPTQPTSPTTTPAANPEPKVGECRRTDPFVGVVGSTTEVREPVPCGDTHNAETYFVGLMNESMQAAARQGKGDLLRAEVSGICSRKLSGWLGGSGADVALSVFDFIVGAPASDAVGPDQRWFSCDVYAVRAMNGLKLIALPATTQGILRAANAADWSRCNRGGFGNGSTNNVVCTRPHSYRAVAAVHLGDLNAKYPSSQTLDSRLSSDCSGRVRAYLNTTASFHYGYTWPGRKQWDTGDRWGICYAETDS